MSTKYPELLAPTTPFHLCWSALKGKVALFSPRTAAGMTNQSEQSNSCSQLLWELGHRCWDDSSEPRCLRVPFGCCCSLRAGGGCERTQPRLSPAVSPGHSSDTPQPWIPSAFQSFPLWRNGISVLLAHERNRSFLAASHRKQASFSS